MRKRVFGRKLSRGKGARKALFRSLIRALVKHGKIKTTRAKAKAVQGMIDKMVVKAKKNDLASRRRVFALLGNDKQTARDIFTKIIPLMNSRVSGFTRLIPLPARRGDLAERVRLEWVVDIEKEIDVKEKTKKVVSREKVDKEKVKKSKKSTSLKKVKKSVRPKTEKKKVSKSKK
jgi:large subunit ribosomal protein L17